MLSLFVHVLELLVLVSIVVAVVVKRSVRDDRRPLARHIVRPLQHDKQQASIGEQVDALPSEVQQVTANPPTQQAKATPTGRVRYVGRGHKILRLEELARGDEIVTRVSRFNRSGKQLGQPAEQQVPLEDAVKMLVKG